MGKALCPTCRFWGFGQISSFLQTFSLSCTMVIMVPRKLASGQTFTEYPPHARHHFKQRQNKVPVLTEPLQNTALGDEVSGVGGLESQGRACQQGPGCLVYGALGAAPRELGAERAELEAGFGLEGRAFWRILVTVGKASKTAWAKPAWWPEQGGGCVAQPSCWALDLFPAAPGCLQQLLQPGL